MPSPQRKSRLYAIREHVQAHITMLKEEINIAVDHPIFVPGHAGWHKEIEDKLAEIADNSAIKVPLTWAGLKACKHFSDNGRMVNVTLCFSANQALLAAKAGAAFISPFIGRLDDIHLDGMDLIQDLRQIYDNYTFKTEILAASIRSVNHVQQSALVGADVITAPPSVIKKLAEHPLTDKGLETFLSDWAKTGQKII